MVGFQWGPARARNPIQIKFSSSTLSVPEVLHEVKELNNPSLMQNRDTPGVTAYDESICKT